MKNAKTRKNVAFFWKELMLCHSCNPSYREAKTVGWCEVLVTGLPCLPCCGLTPEEDLHITYTDLQWWKKACQHEWHEFESGQMKIDMFWALGIACTETVDPACRPRIPQQRYWQGTVRQGSVRFNLTEVESATCLYRSCYIIYLWSVNDFYVLV